MVTSANRSPAQDKAEQRKSTPMGANGQDGPIDPFDIEALRSARPSRTTVPRRVLLSVDVRRPGSGYFRVHPDPDYRLDAPLLMHEAAMDKTF